MNHKSKYAPKEPTLNYNSLIENYYNRIKQIKNSIKNNEIPDIKPLKLMRTIGIDKWRYAIEKCKHLKKPFEMLVQKDRNTDHILYYDGLNYWFVTHMIDFTHITPIMEI